MEILKMDSDIDDLISRRASMRDLKHSALEKGFRPLAQDGIPKKEYMRRKRELSDTLMSRVFHDVPPDECS